MFSSADMSVQDTVNKAVENSAEQTVSSVVVNELKKVAETGDFKTLLILGTVGGVVAGIAWLGIEEKERKKNKYYHDIMLIEENHKSCLRNIPVSPTETLDLVDIFDADKQTKKLHAQRDYKTLDELRKLIKERSSEGFPKAATDEISCALLNLLIFLEDRIKRSGFWQGAEEGDATSVFLRYHIARLYEYGRKFQGTYYTSAVLQALHHSINQFRVQHGAHTERADYLERVCRPLRAAIKVLAEYKNERTLAEIIADAAPDCDEIAVRFMHNLTKLVIPQKYWSDIASGIDPQLLQQNLVREKIAHTSLGSHSKTLFLHPAPIGQNIRKIATNYNNAKHRKNKSNSFVSDYRLITANVTQSEEKQNFTLFTEKQKHMGIGIARWGQHISNFMTTISEPGQPGKDSETRPLTEQDRPEILFRISLFNNLADLSNDDVKIMDLFSEMEAYAKIEGDKKLADPNGSPEIHYMFDVLLALGTKLCRDAAACERGLMRVEDAHEYRTLDPAQASLLIQLRRDVISLRQEVESSLRAINDYRSTIHYVVLQAEIKVHEHQTLQKFANVAAEHGLLLSQRLARPSLRKEEQTKEVGKSTLSVNAQAIAPASTSMPSLILPGGSLTSITEKRVTSTLPLKSEEIAIAAKAEITLGNLDRILADIHMQVIENSKVETTRPYLRLHEALTVLRQRYIKLHGDIDADRRLKAEKTKNLLYEMCEFTLAFLNLPFVNRRTGFEAFAAEMDAKINDPNHGFMDEHFGKAGRYLSEHKNSFVGRLFYFETDTQKEFKQVGDVCHRLGKR